jgi:hypothetical protein
MFQVKYYICVSCTHTLKLVYLLVVHTHTLKLVCLSAVHHTLSSLSLLKYQPSSAMIFSFYQAKLKCLKNMTYRISSCNTRWHLFTNSVLRKCVLVSILESTVFIKVTIFWNVMLCCLVPIYEPMQCKIPEDCNIKIQYSETLKSQFCSCCCNRLYTCSCMTNEDYF